MPRNLPLAALVFLSGCMSTVYKTVEADRDAMDVLEAYRVVDAAARGSKWRCAMANWDTALPGPVSFSLDSEGLTLVCGSVSGNVDFRFPYAATPFPEVVKASAGAFVKLAEPTGQLWPVLGVPPPESEKAVRLARAWSVLAARRPLDAPGFDDAARSYRAAAVGPDLPEPSRRFKVEAEQAVQEKRFIDAAIAYRDGLKLTPWWPQGRFNSALVLAELGLLRDAAAEMGRYLVLQPDAPNARAAQDKIYAWEAKVRK